MIDQKALAQISYGLYILTSVKDGKINGMIVNSLVQVTAKPPQIMAAVNKESLTCEYIQASGVFAAMPILQETQMPFIGNFGFRTGRNYDKFANVKYELGQTGAPLVMEHTSAAYEVKVNKTIDVGSHIMFIGEVINTKLYRENACLTYDYYSNILKGKLPPKGGTHG